jgi:DNA repair exonuclease SbcCD ATPase subunit
MEVGTTAPAQSAAPQTQPNAVPPPTSGQTQQQGAEDPGEWAAKFAGLRREQLRLHKEREAFKSQQKSYEEAQNRIKQYDELEALKASDRVAWLEKNGLSYSELTDTMITRDKDSQLSPEAKELRELRKQFDELKAERDGEKTEAQKKRESEELAEAQGVIQQFRDDTLKPYLSEMGEQYELLSEMPGGLDLAMQTIEEAFADSGELPDLQRVCELTQQHLVEQLTPILSLRSVQRILRSSAPDLFQDAPTDKAPSRAVSTASFTLTNEKTAAPAPAMSSEYLSDEESKRRAAAILKWN